MKNNKLNASIHSNFVLGGVVHEENAIDFDYHMLITDLKLQQSTNELKFKYVVKGDFLEFTNFITSIDFNSFKEDLMGINIKQKENLDRIVQLIDKSNRYNKGFLHSCMSYEDSIKLEWIGC